MMEIQTMIGHGILVALLGYVIVSLRQHGIKFDIRVWRNGKDRDEKE